MSDLDSRAKLIAGLDSNGTIQIVKIGSDGSLIVSGGGGGTSDVIVIAPIPGAATQTTLASIDGKTPTLGANTAANSQPVTLANDGVFAVAFGATTDAAASTDTATASFLSLFKRLLSIKLPSQLSGDRLKTESLVLASSLTLAISHLVLTASDTEYSISLSAVKAYYFKILSGGTVRFSNITGKVASSTLPYYSLDLASEESQNLGSSYQYTGILYFASSVPGTIILIQTWS